MRFLSDREEIKVVAAYIVVCIVWGSTYLGIRIGVSDFPPELFSGIRTLWRVQLFLCTRGSRDSSFPKAAPI